MAWRLLLLSYGGVLSISATTLSSSQLKSFNFDDNVVLAYVLYKGLSLPLPGDRGGRTLPIST